MQVAVLGGGIAGLGAAIALALEGVEVRVFERDSEPRGIGGGVVAWPNAVFVLEALGLGELCAAGGRIEAMERLGARGELLGSLDVGRLSELMGRPARSLLRRDLHRALLARAQALGVAVELGRTLESIEEGPGGARARFIDGGAVEAELLLGAEGRMRSPSRAFVAGSSEPVYQGFVNWVGVARFEEPRFAGSLRVWDFWSRGERFGVVPVSPHVAYWAGGAARELAPRVRGGHQARLLERFAGWSSLAREVVEATPDAEIQEVYVHDHDPLETWQRANLILIGDAAHAALPTSGQGACQALEDAWHLARLWRAGASVEALGQAFSEARQGKTRAVTEAGRRLATSIFAQDPERCAARDEEARGADYGALAEGMARFWGAGLPLGEV